MKRLLDVTLALLVAVIIALPLFILILLVRINSKGPALYWSDRVGINSQLFRMPKLRTMHVNAPVVATHLLNNPDQHLTSLGAFLRRTSLDELPQLWSILKGDMSFVGPRPALYNQYDLITLRKAKGVDTVAPGLTGWAQINGRDELSITEKVRFDAEYLQCRSLWFDMVILWKTFAKVMQRDDISH